MSKIISYLASSQTKIFPDSEIRESYTSASAMANEPFSFVLAYKSAENEFIPISVSAECEGLDISIYKTGYVPVTHTKTAFDEVAYDDKPSGLYPDILLKRSAVPDIAENKSPFWAGSTYYEKNESNLLNATNNAFQSVLICINENSETIKGGQYKINIRITSLTDRSELGNHIFTLNIIDKCLPKTDLMYTNWFHSDCLSDIHGVKVYSDEFFELLEKYLKNASKHKMNTLLLPAFTPPLDTHIGHERQNVQLVKIVVTDNGYAFDFSLMEKFVTLALNCGIEYFEHAHLFTQWGAKHAPNIYAEKDGKEVRIFGWETNASEDEYKHFLECYIPEFLKVMKKLGISDKIFFHISDEPSEKHLESYQKAIDIVSPLIKDYKSGDALSDIKFYQNGFVKTPIVCVAKADNFFGKCPSFWLYYTGGYSGEQKLEKCTNRLVTSKPYRTRILGLHLYKYKAAGFLHWGYNYCYDSLSKGIFDPKTDACGYKQKPGASYLVYPGLNGPLPSLREKYMCEAVCDYKALKLLEEYTSYNEVINLCENFFGKEINVFTIPESEQQMLTFREMINIEIQKHIN